MSIICFHSSFLLWENTKIRKFVLDFGITKSRKYGNLYSLEIMEIYSEKTITDSQKCGNTINKRSTEIWEFMEVDKR